MKKKRSIYFVAAGLCAAVSVFGCSCTQGSQTAAEDSCEYRDIYPDTWVATDALGRTMPSYEEVGPVKNDQRRVVGIFYITWHTQGLANLKSPYTADVTKILEQDPKARLDANHPLWTEGSYHYAEPEMGYFLSQDEWVIRKDISMLADAGVDVMIMDVTNAVRYWDEWDVIFRTMQQMKAEGNKVPKFCFWAFNGPVITVVQDLYERIYEKNQYPDLWFYWDGKPLLLYNGRPKYDANGQDTPNPNLHYDEDAVTNKNNPHYGDPYYTEKFYKDYSDDVKNFFTLRTMWWGYYEWAGERFVGTEDNWSFGYSLADPKVKAMKPEELLSLHNGKREQAAVTPAQHPVTMVPGDPVGVGKSWSREFGQPELDEYDMPKEAYVPWLGKTVKNPTHYGIYFQERWDEALAANPEFLYINDWNEWTAGKYQPGGPTKKTLWLGRENPFYFVDQYNMEFNRGIQPMKGGYTDNYYMQMAQNLRKYKGVRPIPEHSGYTKMKIDGKFSDWNKVKIEFRDTKGDVTHRDAKGYGGLHYTNNSGRNDIITAKVAVNEENVSFFAETASPLTPCTDSNWMLLVIDADNNSSTGWYGYDFLINKQIKDEETTTLMRYDESKSEWVEVAELPMAYSENKLEISVPRDLLGLTADAFVFDFKWSDNPAELKDPISFCTDGDTAPNRRFNYRFIWKR